MAQSELGKPLLEEEALKVQSGIIEQQTQHPEHQHSNAPCITPELQCEAERPTPSLAELAAEQAAAVAAVQAAMLDLTEPHESDDSGFGTPPAPAPEVALRSQRPYGNGRITFLVLHYVPFFAQLCLMGIAWMDGNRLLLGCTIATLGFSGLFYSYVAWHTPAQGPFEPELLPLRERPRPLALALMLPYGLLQWVVVELHLSEDSAAGAEPAKRGQSIKFLSYKAVDAIVESIIVSGALLYSHWTSGLVKGIPILRISQGWLGLLFITSQIAIVASGGLGLMHIDHCCSEIMQERMKSSRYMWCHGFFRTCEVISRLSMLTGFAVMATFHSAWWWLLIVCEVGISAFLVLFHGGLRNTGMATVICTVSATIVNIFCFVDSPARFEYARGISFCLTMKHVVETFLAGLCMIFIMDVRYDFGLHGASLGTAVVATLLYWVLWWVICFPWHGEPDPRENIFSACRNGDLKLVLGLTMDRDVRFDLNVLDIAGMTPLMYTAFGGHAEVCRHLLARGASPLQKALGDVGCLVGPRRWAWQPAGRRWTALHLAAWRGHLEVLRVLLSHGVGIKEHALTLFDADGNTPLHVASMFRQYEAFDVIRRQGPQDWARLPNGNGDLPKPRPNDLAALLIPGEEPELADELADEPAELVVPVTFNNVMPHAVPMGLSSSLVCASSGQQVTPAFEPRALVSENETAWEQRQRDDEQAARLRFDELRPCRADGAALQESPLNPAVWKKREVSLGSGAFGCVGRACDLDGNLYAVKCMRKDSRLMQGAAHREAQVAQAVRERPHPCLVKVFLYHHLDDHICVVTDLCHGGTLHDAVLSACKGLPRAEKGICISYRPPPCACKWLAEVFLGLEYVHNKMRGIVRDLKLHNVGLTLPEPTSHAQLLDYGSYRLTGPSRGVHSLGGPFPSCSAGYGSPEILRGKCYDHRTDFYSLGVMIWIIFTGGLGKDALPPFNYQFQSCQDLCNDWQLMRNVLGPSGSRCFPALPSDASDLVLSLTEFKPQRRGSHDDLRAALGRLLGRDLPRYEMQPSEVEEWLQAN